MVDLKDTGPHEQPPFIPALMSLEGTFYKDLEGKTHFLEGLFLLLAFERAKNHPAASERQNLLNNVQWNVLSYEMSKHSYRVRANFNLTLQNNMANMF